MLKRWVDWGGQSKLEESIKKNGMRLACNSTFSLISGCCCCLVAKSCLIFCHPMDYSTPGFPVLHYFPEFAQTHVHWVGDAIQSVVNFLWKSWEKNLCEVLASFFFFFLSPRLSLNLCFESKAEFHWNILWWKYFISLLSNMVTLNIWLLNTWSMARVLRNWMMTLILVNSNLSFYKYIWLPYWTAQKRLVDF